MIICVVFSILGMFFLWLTIKQKSELTDLEENIERIDEYNRQHPRMGRAPPRSSKSNEGNKRK